MGDVTAGGRALARRVAAMYRDNPQVRAVIIGGSVAQGYADGYSDLELGVFWAAPPSDEERKAAIDRLGGEVWAFVPYAREPEQGASEHIGLREIALDGVMIAGTAMLDIKHLTGRAMDACLADVVERYDTDLDKQRLLSAVLHAIPLVGADVVQAWQTEAARYPSELARRMVRENLWLGPWFNPDAYIGRDDAFVLTQHLIWLAQGVLKVLAGLNHVYYPSPEHKWLDQFAAQLHLSPPHLAARLKAALRGDARTGWNTLKAVIDETLTLVEQHMPEVDVVGPDDPHPQVTLAWARARWQPGPPYDLMRAIAWTTGE